jgi:uncharacterized protein
VNLANGCPARFSLAHGGKDRHPYPVPLKVYDRTIVVLKTAVQKAKLGQSEELAAIKRLDEQARRLERHASGPSVEALFTEERARSHQYGGRSVFGAEMCDAVHSGRSLSRIFYLIGLPSERFAILLSALMRRQFRPH